MDCGCFRDEMHLPRRKPQWQRSDAERTCDANSSTRTRRFLESSRRDRYTRLIQTVNDQGHCPCLSNEAPNLGEPLALKKHSWIRGCASSRTIGLLPCRTRHWTNEPYLRRCVASMESCARIDRKR